MQRKKEFMTDDRDSKETTRHRNVRRRRACILALAFCLLMLALIATKAVQPTRLFLGGFDCYGVDVSEYQGEIDWTLLAGQGLSFAYIKATEGSAYSDPCFQSNWENARKTALYVGAYHFFSFDSGGDDQAANFIRAVPKTGGMLPPAIDLELYGAYKRDPKLREDVLRELCALSDALTLHYGAKPVLYVTRRSYELYIKGSGLENPLWVRDVYFYPLWASGDWAMWQFSDRAVLKGYAGREKYIDMNALRGMPGSL